MVRWGWRVLGLAFAGWILLLSVRCHMPRQAVVPSADSTSAIYVVRHGWHAGVAVHRSDLSDGRWPVLEDFPNANYLEVGWGEARYYPGESRGVWGAIRAGAWPTGSVLHVVPVPDSVRATFPQNTIVRVPVDQREVDALSTFIAESFALDSTGGAPVVAPGPYVNSQFYQSSLTYHVFNNCNHWAAAALEAAGCDVAPRWVFTVGQVLGQARECGTVIQQRGGD